MTEYDYSPEGYQRYLDTQRRISKWVQNTNAHASEFRSPFGIRSEVSSGVRTLTSSSKSKPRGDRILAEEGTRTRTDDRGRRNSMSDTTMRQSGSNAATSQRLPAYTPQLRHSYPYSPASREIHATDRTTTHHSHHSHRRAQSLAPRSSQSQSQSQSQARTHHHTSSHRTAHGLDSPRRSSTLPAYVVESPQQSTNTTSYRTHRMHSPHRLSSSHSHHQSHHHHHSRSQSTPRSSSKLSSPLAVSPVYVANPGTYVVIPPRGRKVSVVYT
ncbi:hypothetical protein DFJ43DRAFT_306794 [Lentinula guzmanii]|uniref:Uncharacterized protein n=1 Tax=Lentinula guzmanii TaxID=2804957 RepID=A0AA38JGW4_9AGAR|nr:hypothetical protein DFJ43DRAFT_306794 [Lentinula guzmanii]